MRVKVLGCGNLLSYDEGVGIHAIRILGGGMLPPEVELVEMGKPGVDFLATLEDCDHLIIIDAMAQGQRPPGTIHRFEIDAKNMDKVLGSTVHGFNLAVPLKIYSQRRGHKKPPSSIILLAMEIKERTIFGVGLSAEVKSGLEYLLDMTWHELSTLL